ncbi:MAG TPA: hypothetical protein ENI96_09325 [Sedimenticola thiotaurini]|uniref:SprT-like domain-containing protein n=1 Tax=Sedimenticola thiotaurini TaxID=1543721 RepID=A0A831RPH5_9GAMM|nr:hypothetical protein [Sedimenticola thiotaurini]
MNRSPAPPAIPLLRLKLEALTRLEQYRRQAERHFGRPLPRPRVRWDLRGSSAGQARFPAAGDPEIRFNAQLLADNGEAFIARTVPHELAHVVVHLLHRGRARPHGPEWRAVMILFGADPKRCHDYDLAQVRQRRMRRFSYRCDCRSHRISAIRHNRMLRGQVYLCRHCGGALRPDPDR